MNISRKGFTLIELLVVVLIIGILAAIAVPQYMTTVERSRAVEAQSIVGQISKAQRAYFTEYGDCAGGMDIYMVNIHSLQKTADAAGQAACQSPHFKVTNVNSSGVCAIEGERLVSSPKYYIGIVNVAPNNPSYVGGIYCASPTSDAAGNRFCAKITGQKPAAGWSATYNYYYYK